METYIRCISPILRTRWVKPTSPTRGASIYCGDPWWVAKDVVEILDIERTDSALRSLDEDERGTHTVSTPGGPQPLSIISEPGLYSLILRSRKPEAKVCNMHR